MNKLLFFIVIILLSNTNKVYTQTTSAQLLNDVLSRVTSISSGCYTVNMWNRSLMKTDTQHYYAKVYFFRNNAEKKNPCAFIGFFSYNSAKAYNGESLFTIDNNEKVIRIEKAPEMPQLEDRLRRSNAANLLFLLYLHGQNNIPSFAERLNNSRLDTITENGIQMYKISGSQTFPNTLRISEKDSDSSIFRFEYYIDTAKTSIITEKNWFFLTNTLQYYRFDISPVEPLDYNSSFESILRLDSFLTAGYQLVDLELESKKQVIPPLIEVGDTFPDFRLPLLTGDTLESRSINSGAILLDFWYLSCAPCILSIPAVKQIHQKFQQQGLQIIGINVQDDNEAALKEFVSRYGIDHPILLDAGKSVSRQVNVSGYPTFILIDAASKVVLYRQVGYDQSIVPLLEKKIQEALNQK